MKLFYSAFFFLACSLSTQAQSGIKFDHLYVESEDKWVVYKTNDDGSYGFGFIYIDEVAGPTYNYEGNFTLSPDGSYIPTRPLADKANLKVRLDPRSRDKVAIIPPSRYKDLGVTEFPDWLKYYKTDTGTVKRLYRWGFMYNDWNQYEKALTYLERAYKSEPKYKGLETELAFSYNALARYKEAIIILESMLQTDSGDCYTLKELAYAEQHSDAIHKAIDTYHRAVQSCSQNATKAEIAFNIGGFYYYLKDKENLNLWATETKKWATPGDKYYTRIDALVADLNK